MLNRYKVTMEPGCRTRHGPSRRASCRKLVRRFCSPECQSLLTSVPIWEKAVRAPFLYRLVPPFIGFYRLLPLRTEKVFFARTGDGTDGTNRTDVPDSTHSQVELHPGHTLKYGYIRINTLIHGNFF